jgi:hypothetical protein
MVNQWDIEDTDLLHFYGEGDDHTSADDGNHDSISVTAQYQVGTTKIFANIARGYKTQNDSYQWIDDGVVEWTVEVINDQIPVDRQEVSPPMVGTGLLTSVVYLESNCGTQAYRNTMFSDAALAPCQVSAVIQNAFSAGFPIQTSSDIIAKIPTASLSNLWFRLVDANFKPIKLMAPLYLTLSVNPSEDASEDVSSFQGKMPKDKPTPEQAKQMAQQQAEEQEKQKREAQAQELMTRAIQGLVQEQEQKEAMIQQQMAQQAQMAPNIQQVQGMGGSAESGQQPMTPEEQQQAQEQQQAEQQQAQEQAVNGERKEVLELEAEPIS